MAPAGGGGSSLAPPIKELQVELEAEVLEQLEMVVTRPSFLHALENAASSFMPQRKQPGPSSLRRGLAPRSHQVPPLQRHDQASSSDGDGVASSSTSSGNAAQEATSSAAESSEEHVHEEEADDGWEAAGWDESPPDEPDFVAVDRADVLQALAHHIALLLSKHPEAQNMTPVQLQQALSVTFSALKQTRFRQVCRVGRQVYRWSTLTYSALQFYQNPWLVQAVLTALWTVSRVGARVLMP